MVGWHHQLNGHESEQTPGDSEEQGSLSAKELILSNSDAGEDFLESLGLQGDQTSPS